MHGKACRNGQTVTVTINCCLDAGRGFCHRIPLPKQRPAFKVSASRHQGRTSSKYCDRDHLSISTYLPIHFLGMWPSKFIVKMLLFSPIIKKIFIYLYAWPHVSPWYAPLARQGVVAVQMRLDTVILAAGTVRIATPLKKAWLFNLTKDGSWGPKASYIWYHQRRTSLGG